MRPDIFAAFDPCSASNNFMLSLTISILPVVLILSTFSYSFWVTPNLSSWMFFHPIRFINRLVSRSRAKNLKGLSSFYIIVFSLIVIINLSSLLPYVSSISSHLFFTISIGFPIWLGLVLAGFVKSPYTVTASLLPTGAPQALGPFLSLVELVRLFMRPVTLSLRLAANITAGHIIIGLVGSFFTTIIFITRFRLLVWIIHIGYFSFEIGVSLVQALIFASLLILYSDDHPA